MKVFIACMLAALTTVAAFGQGSGLTVGSSGQLNPPGVSFALTNAWLGFRGSGSITIGALTTVQRDALSPTNGMVIYNLTTDRVEWYADGTWGSDTLGYVPQYGALNLTNWAQLDTNALTTLQPASSVLSNIVDTVTVDGSGNIDTPGGVTADTVGTTANPDIDTAIGSANSAIFAVGEALEAFQTENQTILAEWTFPNLVMPKVPTYTISTNTGTSFEYDWDGAPVQVRVVQGDATRSAVNAPTGDTSKWGPIEIILTDQATNCSLSQIEGHILFGRTSVGGIVPTDIAPDTVIFYQALYTPQYTWFFWRGNQDSPLEPIVGGTGKTTGEAQAPKSIVGTPTYSSVTNAEFDLASARVFRLDNTKDALINTTASRLSSSETNGLENIRYIEMLRPSADRIVWVNTNNFGLRGVEQSNFVAQGTSWRAELINWGSLANESLLYGGGAGAAAGSGSSETDLNDYNAFAWLGTNSSGNLTDSSGNGITGYAKDGFGFTYLQPGFIEANSMTNNASGTSGFTNETLNAWFRGTNDWTLMGWHRPNLLTSNRYIAASWDNGVADSWRLFTGTDGQYKIQCYTNSGSASTLDTGLYSSTSSNSHWALVYDKDAPAFRMVVNGSQSVIPLGTVIDSPNSAFSMHGFYSSGALSTAFRGGFEQILGYTNYAMPLSDIQRISAGKVFSTF